MYNIIFMFEASASTTFFQLPLTYFNNDCHSYVTQLSSRDIVIREDATQQLTLQKPVKKSDELNQNQIVSVGFKNELCDVCEVQTKHYLLRCFKWR